MHVRTVDITGDPDEVIPVLRCLGLGSIDLSANDDEEDVPNLSSTQADLLIAEITPESRNGLRAICEHLPEPSFDVVLKALDTDGPSAGGKMGSISFAAKRLGIPLPFGRDYRRRVYEIDPVVAAVLLEAIERAEKTTT